MPVLMRAVSDTVLSSQTADFGALTLSGAGGFKPKTDAGLETDLIAVTDQTGATRTWSISNGALVADGTPGVDDTVAITCSHADGSVALTIATEADTYSVRPGEVDAALDDIGTASGGARTVKLRHETYSTAGDFNGAALLSRSFANQVHITRHKDSDYPLITAQVEIRHTENLKLSFVEIHYEGADDDKAVFIRGTTSDLVIDNCIIHGHDRDPQGDYSAGDYANVGGIRSEEGSGWSNVTISNCEIYDVKYGIVLLAGTGAINITGFKHYNFYSDGIHITAGSTPPTSTVIGPGVSYRPVGHIDDGGTGAGPHVDHVQIRGASPSSNWTGVDVKGVRMFHADSRGDHGQGVFCSIVSPHLFDGIKVRGCVFASPSAHGVSVGALQNYEIIGNTIVREASGASGNSPGILLGSVTDGGGGIVKNSVAEQIDAPSATLTNNVTLGANGATVAYSDAFDLSPDGADTLAELMTYVNMKANGPLDADSSGGASVGDIGAVGSGYVTWQSSVPGSSGFALDAAYE